jgi:hypothetical protein
MRPWVTSKVGVGCAVLEWSSREVSMVCFKDSSCGGIVHVFIIERSVLGDPDVEHQIAQKSRHRGLDTGGWVDEENVYLMVGDTPDVSLDSLLSS